MDVKQILFAVACTFVLSACGNSKSVNSVFPENGNLDSSSCRGSAIENRYIVHWESGDFSVVTSPDLESFKTKFIEPRLPAIRHIEYDRKVDNFQIFAGAQSFDKTWNTDRVGLNDLWSQGLYGQGVKVAVIDSYVDVNHPQIFPRIEINRNEIPNNGIDDDRNGIVDDVYGASFVSEPGSSTTLSDHGTHVSGTIAADHASGDVRGAAPGATIIPVQFISNDGGGYLGDAVLALQYAASRGAQIVNASWGGAPCVDSLRNAFVELEKKGILIVVAAGNEGSDIDYYPTYPAAFNLASQITVAASTELDIMAGWSNVGFSSVHLAAPGSNIYSTIPGNKTAYFDGTSMAAPLVSGVAAVLWGAKPQATAAQIKKAIIESVHISANREFKTISRGRLDAKKALTRLRELVP